MYEERQTRLAYIFIARHYKQVQYLGSPSLLYCEGGPCWAICLRRQQLVQASNNSTNPILYRCFVLFYHFMHDLDVEMVRMPPFQCSMDPTPPRIQFRVFG